MDLTTKELNEEIDRLKKELTILKKDSQLNSYKLLLECSPDIILQIDVDYNIVVAHLPELPVEQLDSYRGVHIFQLTPPTMCNKLQEVLTHVFATGETIVYETEGEVSGVYKYYLNHVSAIKNELAHVESAYFVCRETTIQKNASMQAIESEQKLKALFEGSSQIISLFDKESKFIWYNRAAYDKSIYFFDKFIAVGERFDQYLKEENRENFNIQFQKALKGEIISYNKEYQYQGRPFFLDIMLQPVYQSGELIGVSFIGNDDTERRGYETRLEKANKELLQQNDQLNQYSYIISHNLRAPIVTLLGLISILNNSKDNPIEKDEIISHISKSAHHLDTVIKDLNDVLMVSDQVSIMSSVDLEAEFDIVQFLLKNEIEQSNAEIDFRFSELPFIFSIKSYIHSILYNLLSNALKYRKGNVTPFVIIKSYKDHNGLLCIEVSDNGIGIDLDRFKDKIFGFYKRFHSHVEGKGLGLHLIKKQIDILGGRIEVESVVGKGTTFRVLLPVVY